MRIQLVSDLHLEVDPGFEVRPLPGADVLVLAGDIGCYQPGSLLDEPDFGLGRFSPRRVDAPWPVVIFVPGNHEYDSLDFDATHQRLRALCQDLGIVWLEREVVVIDGVRFVGTTLWTDFDALASRSNLPGPKAQAARLKARQKALRAADFFLRRNSGTRRGEPVLGEAWRELGLECHAWLRAALAQPHDGSTVVVTHFAPSLRSADPRYGLMPGTAGFCNALDDLIPRADLWLHGHLHCRNDYLVQGDAQSAPGHTTRVVANPLGYEAKDERGAYRPDLLLTVPQRPR